jgi:hypothetical protein
MGMVSMGWMLMRFSFVWVRSRIVSKQGTNGGVVMLDDGSILKSVLIVIGTPI